MNKQDNVSPRAAAGIEAIARMQQTTLATWSRLVGGWCDSTARWQAESGQRLGERVRRGNALATELAACRRPEQLLEWQARQINQMMSDCIVENACLLRWFSEAGNAVVRASAPSSEP